MINKMPQTSQVKDVLKNEIKKLIREWHPDIVGSTSGKNYEVIHLLTELNSSVNEEVIRDFGAGWPESIPDDAKIDFPSGVTIFLPASPEEFFKSLKQYKSGALRVENYPQVKLKRARGELVDTTVKLGQDPTLDKIWKFITESESVDTLLGAFDLFSLYSDEQLREINAPAAVDKRAAFLLARDAWKETTRVGVESIIRNVEVFPFFEPSSRENTLNDIKSRLEELEPVDAHQTAKPSEAEVVDRPEIERAARLSFIAKIRIANSLEDLQSLDTDVQAFNFFNRGELGVVRSVIVRKMRKLESLDKK